MVRFKPWNINNEVIKDTKLLSVDNSLVEFRNTNVFVCFFESEFASFHDLENYFNYYY